MEMKPYVVYIQTNEKNYITAVNSSAFLTDFVDWTEIDRGYGDKYHHAQGNYFSKPICTDSGAYCYKLTDGKLVECTDAEIVLQEKNNKTEPQPSQLDILDSRVTYLAMMTDNLYWEV